MFDFLEKLNKFLYENRPRSNFYGRFFVLNAYFFVTRIALRNFAAGLTNYCVMKKIRHCFLAVILPVICLVSCEELDDDPQKHVDAGRYVELSEVAELLAGIPIGEEHLHEVYDAVMASSLNGYDEEYTMNMLFVSPGSGVGDAVDTKAAAKYQQPLRALIEQHVLASATKSSGDIPEPQKWLDELMESDIQIYWPYSDNWDGKSLPVITFDPEDDSDVNLGYRVYEDSEGNRLIEEIIVDEELAMQSPVWVINRNTDASYKTLEMLCKENPEWGEGGGSIIVQPSSVQGPALKSGETSKSLVLKNFKMREHYDCWFAGASEFMVKVGFVEDFTATTEAELRLYNPKVTDFMIVVQRDRIGATLPMNVVMISDWSEQMSHCAFMISEDDGGYWEDWKCTALVRISSRSYGIEVSIPIKSWDDIVWRGRLAWNWLQANSGVKSRYGDVEITLDVVEY